MPPQCSAWVVKVKRFFTENGVFRESHRLGPDGARGQFDKMKHPGGRFRCPKPLGEIDHKPLSFGMRSGVGDDPALIATQKSPGAELKYEVFPFARCFLQPECAP